MGGYRLEDKDRAKIVNDPLLRRLICPLCSLLLREPTASTCGHLFCRSCVEIHCGQGSSLVAACPIDGQDLHLQKCRHDKHVEEQINALAISCVLYCRSGEKCNWIGQVGRLEEHLKEYHNEKQEEGAKAVVLEKKLQVYEADLEEQRQEHERTARKTMEIEQQQTMQFDMINDLKQQLAAFSDALFAGKQGCDQLESKVRVLEGKVQEQQEMMIGNTNVEELKQQVTTLQCNVETLEEQLRAQTDRCASLRVECCTERERAYEDRNMHVSILQDCICRLQDMLQDLKKRHSDLQNSHADLQTSHADLQTSHADLQTSHADLQTSHANLQSSHADLQAQIRCFQGFS